VGVGVRPRSVDDLALAWWLGGVVDCFVLMFCLLADLECACGGQVKLESAKDQDECLLSVCR
jgi:hypothetical protein